MNSLAQQVADLSPEQRAALRRRLAARRASARDEPTPLAPSQRLLWAEDRLNPEASTYLIPSATRLRGPLDVSALQAALTDMAARHDALRTVIRATPDGPVQHALDASPVPLPLLDVQGKTDPEAAAREAIDAEADRPIDLEAGPLVRALLVRIAPEDHVLLLVIHHIVYDGWSQGVLLRELGEAYAARVQGETPDLPALTSSYAEFVREQHDRLASGALDDALDAWAETLEGVPLLDLPTDHPRPRVPSRRGGAVPFALSAALADRARALARAEQATPFMVWLAVYVALLARRAQQTDFAVLTPVAGRARPEVEGLVGYFVNTVALRADVSGAPSFRTLLRRLRDVAFDAFARQDVPFERVVETARFERRANRTPIAQVSFAFQNAPASLIRLPGLAAEPLTVRRQTSKFDLGLMLAPHADGLEGTLIYDAALFDASTAEHLAADFQALAETLLADSDALAVGAAEEARQARWNQTQQAVPEASLPHLFRAQVARTPDATALDEAGQRWSYADLDVWTDRIARRLLDRGIAVGDHVGVCVDRSAAFVAGMLGALKAGAAYVPLDPAYPAERLALMAEDAALVAVLTPDGAPVAAVPGVSLADTGPDGVEPIEVSCEAAAYVMYTSGSTGRPKGVVVPHRAVAHLVLDTNYVQIGPGDGVAQIASPAFDAATFEVWGALLTGARLVMVDRDTTLDPQRLARAFRERRVDVTFLTTSLFNLVAREAPSAFESLRAVLFGGERADPHAVRAVLAHPPRRLLNAYGPTETTTFASWHEVRDLDDEATSVPIGQPLAGTTLWVLDADRQPVSDGTAGELYVGGWGVAAGYLNRPDLTAERFVPDPFSDRAGATLYRTGDRVRRRPDGALDFLGRLDRQVKLRGYRIEPGEVEAQLRAHPAVAAAHVAVLDPSRPSLDAFVVSADGVEAVPKSIRASLRASLPEPLVPRTVTVVSALPLTPNGKIDERALSALVAPPTSDDDRDEAPATATETALAAIWEAALDVPSPGRHADFFDLGGHSLQAIQIIDRVEQRWGVRIAFRDLAGTPTLAALADRIDAARLLVPTDDVPDPPSFVTEAERLIADIWAEVLGTSSIQPESDFFALGGDAQSVVRMLDGVRRIVGQAPEPSVLEAASTLRAFALHVHDAVVGSADAHVVPFVAEGSGDPVLFVHGVEANSLRFMRLARMLGDRPVYGTQGQGFGGSALTHTTIEEVASAYAEEWMRLGIERPVHLVGLCFGAALALEVARQIRRSGGAVGSVISINQSRLPSERRAPRRSVAERLRATMGRLARRGLRAAATWADARGIAADRVRAIPYVARALAYEDWWANRTREEVLQRDFESIAAAGTAQYDADLVRDAQALVERRRIQGAYRAMLEAYRPDPYAGRVVLVVSDHHADDPVTEGWAAAAPRTERHRVPGPHAPLFEPHVHDLAATIRSIADRTA